MRVSVQLRQAWDDVSTSYWFIPGVMAASAVALAWAVMWMDRNVGFERDTTWSWIFTGGVDGAREVLSSIATSMITVAGVAFSVTIVALQLAASQFGHRVLRNFRQDRGSQFVLGTFTATLLVLRNIVGEGDEQEAFVPYLAVTVGVSLAVLSVGVLIFFVHHVAVLIQAPYIVARVARELDDTIDELFEVPIGEVRERRESERDVPDGFEGESEAVAARRDGYIQMIDGSRLLELARHHDLILRVVWRPGHFVSRGTNLLRVWPGESLDERLAAKLVRCVVIGNERSPHQDVEYAIDQLGEIASRALSTGINDPYTTINCIDRVGAGLQRLASGRFPERYRYDDDGSLRVIVDPASFASVASAGFDKIRQYGRSSPAVVIRMLETVALVIAQTQEEEYREVLRHQAVLIHRAGMDAFDEEWDRRDLERRMESVRAALEKREEVRTNGSIESTGG
jgi:uncharacterized membrane protein